MFQGRKYVIERRLVNGERQKRWTLAARVYGKRLHRSLGTPNKAAAIEVAKRLLGAAQRGHWDALDAVKIRREEMPAAVATIGDVLRVYEREIRGRAGMTGSRTPICNVSALRVIVRTVAGEKELETHSTEILTRDLIEKFKVIRGEARATSVNSTITQARAVFSSTAMELYADRGLLLPDLSGFMSARKLKDRRDVSFRPIAPEVLAAIEAGSREAAAPIRLIYLMAYELGMRCEEIIQARKDWLEVWPDGIRMAVVRRPYFVPKGREGRIPMRLEVAEEIRNLWSKDSVWILPGSTPTSRRNAVMRHGAKWIRQFFPDREKGWHELRKQVGSEIAAGHGLTAARDFLRHKSQTTTEAHYVTLLSPVPARAV